MRQLISRPLIYIVLLNLLVKLGMFCYIGSWNKDIEKSKIVISDSQGYETEAEDLTNYNSFIPPSRNIEAKNFSEFQSICTLGAYPDSYWMPGYPLYLATIYKAAGIKPFMGILIQILLSTISLLMVYKIALLIFQKQNIALLSSLIFSLDIHSAYVANELLPDTVFIVLFLSSVYLFLKGFLNNSSRPIVWSALFMGITCLMKPIALLFPVIPVLLLFIFNKQPWKWKITTALVYGLIYVSLIGIWSFRNHSVYNHWGISTQGGESYIMYNVAMTEARITHQPLDSVRVQIQKEADSIGFRKLQNPFDKEAIYKKMGTGYILNHLDTYTATHLQGCVNMFLSLGNRGMANTFGWANNNIEKNIAEVSSNHIKENFSSNIKQTLLGLLIAFMLLIQYVGAIYGSIQLLRQRNYIFLILSLATIVYWAGLIGVVGMYRYRVPLVAFFAIAAAYGYFTLIEKYKQRKGKIN